MFNVLQFVLVVEICSDGWHTSHQMISNCRHEKTNEMSCGKSKLGRFLGVKA